MGESQLLLLLRILLLPTVLIGWMDCAEASTADIYKGARLGHRIVQTRYGRLHGLILPLDSFRFLRSVEVFLGVPYATPPTQQNRFSPTRAPAPWDGIRISDKYSPVCPQRLPNIQNETAALEKMPKGRLEYLKRLLPFLENQSEDCLYLNVFSPVNAGANEKKLPVMVFIHGESFEWSSGNPYDGSVLASYGEVVVVTLNYRLGILGFLNANPNPHAHARVANYGLMDQMAALHWIQQNIQKFGGDPNSVTLAGHGTGAACINYLMTSTTMVRGLFHRAILMSGSAYSSWALVEDPVLFAIKLAREVNCTIPEDINRHHEQIVDCLRDVPLDDLYSADIQAPNFLTSFGPSVDGVVIRPGHSNLDIDDLMARNSRRSSADSGFQSSAGGGGGPGGGGGGGGGGGSGSAFGGGYFGGGGAGAASMGGHYDVLFGVVTGESIWRFSAHDIQNGFEGERRDKIIRTYVRNAYNYHLNEIFYTIVNEYTDWDRTSQHPINTRDTAVAALSDAQFVAPIVRAGDILAANSPPPVSSSSPAGSAGANAAASTSAGSTQPSGRCYFYVFDYQTKDGDYPQRMGTVHGEDLPYIFGAPLVDGFSHFPQNYTKSETALSEAVMIFWTNFARTGNPNEHHRQDSSLPVSKERNRFRSITWENYDPLHQKYLEIGMKPRIKNHFRAHQLSIWLRLIPELHRAGMEDVIARHNLFRNHDDMDLYEGPVKPDPFGISSAGGATGSTSSSSSSSRLLLIDEQLMMKKGRGLNATAYLNGILGVTTVEPNNMYTTCIPVGGNYSGGGGVFAPTTLANASSDTLASGFEAAGYAAYSTALSVTIAIGCSLLILNVLIFAGVYYQRDKTRLEVKTLQKQYQQRSLHQQVPYPPEPIKHAHYHMGHSQSSANVIVDVESHQDQAGQAAMLLQAAAAAAAAAVNDVKPPPPHICSNTGMQQQQQQQVGGGSGGALNNGGIEGSKVTTDNLGNVTYSTSSKQQQQHQHQQQQQQQREHMQIKGMTGTQTFGRGGGPGSGGAAGGGGGGGGGGSASGGASVVVSGSSVSYNPGMMTLPKSGGLHHAATLNYARNTAALNLAGGGTALVDSRGNVLLTSTAVGPGLGGGGGGGGGGVGGGGVGGGGSNSGDCMTLPRNLSLAAAGRHNPTAAELQQYQQQQQSSKHQANGAVLTGMQSHHIRGPRPPLRTASSTTTNSSSNNSAMGVAVGGAGGSGGVNMLLDQTPSGGSSSSGVSSAPSSSKGHHTHSHSHAAHLVHSHGDGLVLTSASPVGGQQQLQQHPQQHQHPQQQQQQQVPQAAMDEMRV
ncbi:neuroligin 4-like isoform X1 [Drosophila elegans]|uniref:neuroligin 4-like isoform X1 n=1 Tax=Drosophila elegans TaxID=30023 RepID=UPI0007E77D1C|nr:neuroligin 4-like isoform X1 [Drosophila elegans]XP_017113779.1 neuroligin 4-like isoform X1 [Drosophila elegans]XP_017113780.1 neuroligin 4-like isoform X1 [Drosophila elegans]XP_017113781.1 neuroligin 4-like isoform X1 [Drosophila elegans]XP_017113782.1 neuroligin 4-like isoform X1 [Drosophila elegans]